jgi:hypothetical protein
MRFAVVVVALLLLSCGKLAEITGPIDEPFDDTATFTRVQTEVFTPSCVAFGCHDAIGQQEGLTLAAGRAHAEIVGVPSTQMSSTRRVEPGDFARSYLYRKITGVNITGERMPSGGPYLNDGQLRLVREWIRRGAPND